MRNQKLFHFMLTIAILLTMFPLSSANAQGLNGRADKDSKTIAPFSDAADYDKKLELHDSTSVPDINAELTVENAMAILKAYDDDGYYIVKYMIDHKDGEKNVKAFLHGENVAESLDTVVHELFHSYCFWKNEKYRVETIYIGNGNDIDVVMIIPGSEITPTSKWAETLPDDLRTFRFSDYVSKDSELSANVEGPYGLLNEFTAYCWGMHNQLALFPYYKAQGNTFDVWQCFVGSCANNRQAYAEFRFWILGYLNYLKTNEPASYSHYMNDKEFLNAYLTIKKRFEKQIEEFNKRGDEIISLAEADGISAQMDGDSFWFGRQGTGTFYSVYKKLLDEINKSEYQLIETEISKNSTGSSDDSVPSEEPKPSESEKPAPTPKPSESEKPAQTPRPSGSVTPTSVPDPSPEISPSHAQNCPSAKLSDMKNTENEWYHKGIDYVLDKGYMAGVENNRFAPNRIVTRAMIAQILYAAEGKPRTSGSSFSDVEAGQWYSSAIGWAAQKKLVAGYGNGRFGPNDGITREQLAAILYQYSKFKSLVNTKTADLGRFNDNKQISRWAREAMEWASANALLSGFEDSTIRPKGNATRAQLATILFAYDSNVRKK